MIRMTGAPAEKGFLTEVITKSGENLLACLQCGKCSGGCPISSDEVGGPRQLIAKILYGAKEKVLEDPTWWYCVACGTCMTRCPVEINMYRVSNTLCELAEEAKISPSEPDIHLFEELMLDSVERYGRLKELKVVMNFNLKTHHPFKDLSEGLTLIGKGAINPLEMIKGGRKDPRVARIFSKLQKEGAGE